MTAELVRLPKPASKAAPEKDRRLRRLAMQIVVQLPQGEQDALTVLKHAEALVRAS